MRFLLSILCLLAVQFSIAQQPIPVEIEGKYTINEISMNIYQMNAQEQDSLKNLVNGVNYCAFKKWSTTIAEAKSVDDYIKANEILENDTLNEGISKKDLGLYFKIKQMVDLGQFGNPSILVTLSNQYAVEVFLTEKEYNNIKSTNQFKGTGALIHYNDFTGERIYASLKE